MSDMTIIVIIKSYQENKMRKEQHNMQEFVPFKPEKEVISIRLESKLLKKVDNAAENANISRNEFINQCIVYALEHLSCDRN